MALPKELAEHFGHLRFIEQRATGEWSSECPSCGDYGHVGNDFPDRFRMFAKSGSRDARGWCRSCGYFKWANSDREDSMTPRMLAKIETERKNLANKERERVREMIDKLTLEQEWLRYHNLLNEKSREYWQREGIAEDLQDFWCLGYNPEMSIYYDGDFFMRDAVTIPYFHGDRVLNIQSRILEPVKPHDKYRFKRELPVPLYFPDKEVASVTNKLPVLCCEGAKKGMVAWYELGARYQVISCPSKYPSHDQIATLSEAESIFIVFDPDGEDQAYRAGEKIKAVNERVDARVVTLPDKIDDLFVKHKANRDQIDAFIKQGRPV